MHILSHYQHIVSFTSVHYILQPYVEVILWHLSSVHRHGLASA